MEELNAYLETNYDKLLEISIRITSNRKPDYYDLLHETIEALYKTKQDKIINIIVSKKMTFYIIRILINQYHSKTSPYYYKYKKYNELMNNYDGIYIYSKEASSKERMKELELNEERLKWIDKKLEGLNWFDVSVFKLYYKESFSLNSMSRATKINRSTLGKSIRYIKNFLKNEKQK